MTITAVGSMAIADASGATTITASPVTAGDCWLLAVKLSSTTISVSSISGGGATWSLLISHTDSTNSKHEEIWLGKISTTGASNIVVTFSSSNSGVLTEMLAQEFTAGLGSGTVWTGDGTNYNNGTGTAVTCASITPSAAGEIYYAFAWNSASGATAGSTPGYVYTIDSTGNMVVYNPSCTSATQSPTLTQTSGNWFTIAAMVSASASLVSHHPFLSTVAIMRASNW